MTVTPKNLDLKDDNLPGIFNIADKTSLRGQSNVLFKTRMKIYLLIAAAIVGSMTFILKTESNTYDIAGVMTALFFVAAVFIEAKTADGKSDDNWFEGRAAAESAKTQAWRFAVGGKPYPIDMDLGSAAKAIGDRFEKILGDLKNLDISPTEIRTDAVTERMLEIRNLSLEARKYIYIENRIRQQQAWYSRKSAENELYMTRWSWSVIFLEVCAIIGSILKAVSIINIDSVGILTTLIAGAVSWTQIKQYRTLKNAYAIAAHDLSIITSRHDSGSSELLWSEFVNEAEEAISREHTVWRARESTNGKTKSLRSISEI